MSGAGERPVLTSVRGRAAHLVLNRPRALNALTHEMVGLIDAALTAWEKDDAVETVVLTGAGERGLCAGGDIRAVYEAARDGDGREAADFWRDEYRLNARVPRYPVPYVAVMDGIVMGGGIGVSAHGSVRIVTERTKAAMPETGIGFVPDVGGTWLLSRAPGHLGTRQALTGTVAGPGDALRLGLADHYVPSSALPELLEALGTLPADEAVGRYAAEAPPAALDRDRGWIDACYAADTVEEIVERLRARPEEAAHADAATLAGRSPTSLKVTLEALRRVRALATLEEALDQEYRVSLACLATPDLVEGIRAQVVDKDRDPHWNPASLAEVDASDVARFFTSLGERELGLAPTPEVTR
ncbi:enoyl-CoA hydratase/isomerase family protein [Streptomyces sp. NRRL F-5630]|uniref:enoyl-CoA hydratase/isomerase family protein n=1 Tax=Streptomyces sp. NRRL F-5630 TaxID=1463864 RepID=UPI0004C5B6AE|nr:enoyl-CoA hydratase/isomerase family protein [Streptomyces sp. NRRL F-5630]